MLFTLDDEICGRLDRLLRTLRDRLSTRRFRVYGGRRDARRLGRLDATSRRMSVPGRRMTVPVERKDGIRKRFVAGQMLTETVDRIRRGVTGEIPVVLIVFYAGAPGLRLSQAASS
jgi:hypothetical protein